VAARVTRHSDTVDVAGISFEVVDVSEPPPYASVWSALRRSDLCRPYPNSAG